MNELIVVFAGGGLGSIARFGLGNWVNSLHQLHYPFGTLVVNIVACFTLGLIIGLADQKQLFTTSTRLFWVVGFCGGFSTFSAFSSETLLLFQQGQQASSGLYIIASVILSISALICGLIIVRKLSF